MNIFSDFFTKKNKIGNNLPFFFTYFRMGISSFLFQQEKCYRNHSLEFFLKTESWKLHTYFCLGGVLFKNIKVSAEQFSNTIITINAEIGTNTDSHKDKDNSLNVNNLNKKEPRIKKENEPLYPRNLP